MVPPGIASFPLVHQNLIVEDDMPGLFKDVWRDNTIVVEEVDHVRVVIAAKDGGDAFNSADADVGIAQSQTFLAMSSHLPDSLKYSYLTTFFGLSIVYNSAYQMMRMPNIVGYYRFMLKRSIPLRVTLYGALVTFPLSIAFTIACLILDCSYSIFYHPCSYAIEDNPYECSIGKVEYCCGSLGEMHCGKYDNCQFKPYESITTCEGLLITSWVVYFLFIVSVVLFFVIHRKLGPQLADEYTRMSQNIEISQGESDRREEEPPGADIQNNLL